MQYTQGNSEKQYERKGSNPSIRETRWVNMERKWSGIYRRKNLGTKQQED